MGPASDAPPGRGSITYGAQDRKTRSTMEHVRVQNNTKQVIGVSHNGALRAELPAGGAANVDAWLWAEFTKRAQVRKMLDAGDLEIVGASSPSAAAAVDTSRKPLDPEPEEEYDDEEYEDEDEDDEDDEDNE